MSLSLWNYKRKRELRTFLPTPLEFKPHLSHMVMDAIVLWEIKKMSQSVILLLWAQNFKKSFQTMRSTRQSKISSSSLKKKIKRVARTHQTTNPKTGNVVLRSKCKTLKVSQKTKRAKLSLLQLTPKISRAPSAWKLREEPQLSKSQRIICDRIIIQF